MAYIVASLAMDVLLYDLHLFQTNVTTKLWYGVFMNAKSIVVLFMNGNIGHTTHDLTIPTTNFTMFSTCTYGESKVVPKNP